MSVVPIKVKGGRQGKNTERQVRPKKSCFLLTISTNQRYKEDDPNLENDELVFEEAVKKVLRNLPSHINVIEEGHKWDSTHIKDVDVDYTIERGVTGQLHTHILLKFNHHTKLRLDYASIKKSILDDLGLDNLYMQNKLVRPTSDDWLRDYLAKSRMN